MNEQEFKEFFKSTFNTVADGYDSLAMSFFQESAQHISSFLNMNGDEHVLDVATGTGNVALTLAKELPNGQVTGIDFSEGMLSQAIRKKIDRDIHNVTFVEMDMQSLNFNDNYFDVVVNAFSLFFVKDMEKQLSHIAVKVKKNGKIIMTTFSNNAFSPLVDFFYNRLEKYGIEIPTPTWKQVATKQQCISLFQKVGLQNINSKQIDSEYYLSQASDWWSIIWNGGFRGLVSQLSTHDLAKFKQEHLSEIEELASDKGIRLEMPILYTIGTKL